MSSGHTIRNSSSQEAGYEGYQHVDPTAIRHKIGLGAVYQRLTNSYGAWLIQRAQTSDGELIQTNRANVATLLDNPHNYGSYNVDVIIMNLTLCNISEFDEQVQIDQSGSVGLTTDSTYTDQTGFSALPPQFWIPKGTTFTLYNKNSPGYFLRNKNGSKIRFKTVNNENSIDLVCHYALVDQEAG